MQKKNPSSAATQCGINSCISSFISESMSKLSPFFKKLIWEQWKEAYPCVPRLLSHRESLMSTSELFCTVPFLVVRKVFIFFLLHLDSYFCEATKNFMCLTVCLYFQTSLYFFFLSYVREESWITQRCVYRNRVIASI